MTSTLARVSDLIHRETGIVLKPTQMDALEAAIARVDEGMTSERLLAMAGSTDVVQRLIDQVTVRETFFFRHRAELDAIDWRAALSSARARGSDVVRVWVAACASGEEAYTVALLACEAYASATPPVRITASDIAVPALEQARVGRYGPRAARLLAEPIRRRYFIRDGDSVQVGTALRALVDVVHHNLVLAALPPGGDPLFDVILCRNVLIYFDQPTAERVVGRLERALAPAGTLVLGAADRLSGQRWREAPVQVRADRRRSAPPRPAPAALRPGASGAAAARRELDSTLKLTTAALARDPLSADAYYVRGVAELAGGDASRAVASLRRALYVDPCFTAAAFTLARAHDDLGDFEAARTAYRRTLRTLDGAGAASPALLDTTDRGDIAVACRARLSAMPSQGP